MQHVMDLDDKLLATAAQLNWKSVRYFEGEALSIQTAGRLDAEQSCCILQVRTGSHSRRHHGVLETLAASYVTAEGELIGSPGRVSRINLTYSAISIYWDALGSGTMYTGAHILSVQIRIM